MHLEAEARIGGGRQREDLLVGDLSSARHHAGVAVTPPGASASSTANATPSVL